jgi:peptidoglycan/xylan/chitin deacetylase (PgdA/CDA1 family)
MRCVVLAVYLAATGLCAPALAAPCPGNPNALGTSRTIAIDPAQYGRLGTQQYGQFPQLPLADREVVLTFDDGPVPQYTDSVLRTLASECVKATFFMVGRQAAMYPEAARRVHEAGHTIGTHSQNHPLTFDAMSISLARREVEDGITAVNTALGDGKTAAPLFRIPGLLRTNEVEDYLASRGLSVWSVDADADDWLRSATPDAVTAKLLSRIEKRGRGILLLHDVQPVTALALPQVLRALKQRGYRVVHVVPQGPVRQTPLMASKQPQSQQKMQAERQGWPRVATTGPVTDLGFRQWEQPSTRRQPAPAVQRYGAPTLQRYAAPSVQRYTTRSAPQVTPRYGYETRRAPQPQQRWIYVR